MMPEQEHIDPLYKYVDEKIKTAVEDLSLLIEALRTDVNKRIGATRILGFQKQLSSIGDQVRSIEAIQLAIRRLLARDDLRIEVLMLTDFMRWTPKFGQVVKRESRS